MNSPSSGPMNMTQSVVSSPRLSLRGLGFRRKSQSSEELSPPTFEKEVPSQEVPSVSVKSARHSSIPLLRRSYRRKSSPDELDDEPSVSETREDLSASSSSSFFRQEWPLREQADLTSIKSTANPPSLPRLRQSFRRKSSSGTEHDNSVLEKTSSLRKMFEDPSSSSLYPEDDQATLAVAGSWQSVREMIGEETAFDQEIKVSLSVTVRPSSRRRLFKSGAAAVDQHVQFASPGTTVESPSILGSSTRQLGTGFFC
jgi:hypothetical protein